MHETSQSAKETQMNSNCKRYYPKLGGKLEKEKNVNKNPKINFFCFIICLLITQNVACCKKTSMQQQTSGNGTGHADISYHQKGGKTNKFD